MQKNSILFSIIVFFCLISLQGCIYVLLGAGAAGGYVTTRDTIQGEYDADFSDAWDAALEAAETVGSISVQDSVHGVIEALVDRAKVKITIEQITPSAIRVKVKARRATFIPRLGTAEKVFIRIAQELMR